LRWFRAHSSGCEISRLTLLPISAVRRSCHNPSICRAEAVCSADRCAASGSLRFTLSVKVAGKGCDKRTNRKGCGFGYALAADSCEEVSRVDACTTTAPDVTTAFAVPNPNCLSPSRWFFRVWLPSKLPRRASHPAYFELAKVNLPVLSAIDGRKLNQRTPPVNA